MKKDPQMRIVLDANAINRLVSADEGKALEVEMTKYAVQAVANSYKEQTKKTIDKELAKTFEDLMCNRWTREKWIEKLFESAEFQKAFAAQMANDKNFSIIASGLKEDINHARELVNGLEPMIKDIIHKAYSKELRGIIREELTAMFSKMAGGR